MAVKMAQIIINAKSLNLYPLIPEIDFAESTITSMLTGCRKNINNVEFTHKFETNGDVIVKGVLK